MSKYVYRVAQLLGAVQLMCSLAGEAVANPQGGNVAAGSATITTPNADTLQVHQSSDKAIINWQSFNIDLGETTEFFQPGQSSITLNRVVGSQDPSRILGTLKSNGTVVIVNPDGVLFGAGSRIDVGGLIASTADIHDEDFLAGNYVFSIPGNPSASIVNEGNISVADHGVGALVAPGVRNSGVITARLGKVALTAANGFTLDLYGDRLINLMVDDEIASEVIDVATGKTVKDLVKNDGKIRADGGVVALSAATARRAVNSVINNSGVVEARSVGRRGGKIILGAQTKKSKRTGAPKQVVKVSGKLDVSGQNNGEKGGQVRVLGESLHLSSLNINASGFVGGGAVLIGGDYLGGNGDSAIIERFDIPLEKDTVPTASETYLDTSVSVNADALSNGDGGKLIVWSDGTTYTAAELTARGGAEGGDGGFIETSGKETLTALRAADASAVAGENGTWLLDPNDLIVSDTPFSSDVASDTSSDPNLHVALADTSFLNFNVIFTALSANTDVTLIATGDITVGGGSSFSISKINPGEATLKLIAGNQIRTDNKNFAALDGQLNISFTAPHIYLDGVTFDTGGGYIVMDSLGSFASNVDIFATNSVFNSGGGDIEFRSSGDGINNFAMSFRSSAIDSQGGDITFQSNDGLIELGIFGAVSVSTSGGDLDVQSTDGFRYGAGTLDTAGGSFNVSGGDGNVLLFGTSINTSDGAITLDGNSVEVLNQTNIDAGTGSVSIISDTDILFSTVNNTVISGDVSMSAADLINLEFTTFQTSGDATLTAAVINGDGTNPTIVAQGDVTLTGAGLGMFMLGQSSSKLTLNYTGGGASSTPDFYGYRAGCAGGDCYSWIAAPGFGTVELNKAAGFSADYVDITVYGNDLDEVGTVLTPNGFYFQGIGIDLLGQIADEQAGPPGIETIRGATVNDTNLIRINAGGSGIFFGPNAFNVGSQLSFRQVTNVNGGAPTPTTDTIPYSGNGAVFLNGEEVNNGEQVVPPEEPEIQEPIVSAAVEIPESRFESVGMVRPPLTTSVVVGQEASVILSTDFKWTEIFDWGGIGDAGIYVFTGLKSGIFSGGQTVYNYGQLAVELVLLNNELDNSTKRKLEEFALPLFEEGMSIEEVAKLALDEKSFEARAPTFTSIGYSVEDIESGKIREELEQQDIEWIIGALRTVAAENGLELE